MDRTNRRLQFVECHIEGNGSADSVRAQVVLSGGGVTFTGNAERPGGDDSDLWAAAEATTAALREALGLGSDTLWLRDVVAFTIADSPAVAASLRTMVDDRKRSLHGLSKAEPERARAAALSVLSATNRFFGEG